MIQVIMNKPDLILFIGEALVGNDAIDQLSKFNKSLIDLSPKDNVREIDGIILSKFDTVDDKGKIISKNPFFQIFQLNISFYSWSCYFYDLSYRKAYTILWSWSKVYSFKEAKC